MPFVFLKTSHFFTKQNGSSVIQKRPPLKYSRQSLNGNLVLGEKPPEHQPPGKAPGLKPKLTQPNLTQLFTGGFCQGAFHLLPDIHMCSRVHVRTPQAVEVGSCTPENICTFSKCRTVLHNRSRSQENMWTISDVQCYLGRCHTLKVARKPAKLQKKIQQDALGKVNRVMENWRREKDGLKITDNSIIL